MKKWSNEMESEITFLLKDWLKQHNKTQKDLKNILHLNSERMNAFLDLIRKDYLHGGLQEAVKRLCEIENEWRTGNQSESLNLKAIDSDPFGQLDLLLEEMKEDSEN